MTSKIVSIKLPNHGFASTEKIRQIFGHYSLQRVQIHDQTVYIQFSDQNDIQTLDVQFPNLKVSALDNAQIDLVEDEFQWQAKKSSKGSSIQDLSIPTRDSLIMIKNCDYQRLKQFEFQKLKSTIFAKFDSLNRGIVQGNNFYLQFLDRGEIQKLQVDFPDFKVAILGQFAQIDVVGEEYDLKRFAQQWTKQSKNRNKFESKYQIASPQSLQKTQKLQQDVDIKDKYLHAQIIPTLDKTTSIEQNFRSSLYAQTKEKWEKGTIKEDNLNNQDHRSVTRIYEDQEIPRSFPKQQKFKDPKLKEYINRIKSRQVAEQELNNRIIEEVVNLVQTAKNKRESSQKEEIQKTNYQQNQMQQGQQNREQTQEIQVIQQQSRINIIEQYEVNQETQAPKEKNTNSIEKIQDVSLKLSKENKQEPKLHLISPRSLSLEQKLIRVGFWLTWSIFILTYL